LLRLGYINSLGASSVIGITAIGQSEEDIAARKVTLLEETIAEINQTIRRFPSPFLVFYYCDLI